MVKPGSRGRSAGDGAATCDGAPLISQRAANIGKPIVVCDNHATLACRDLLVGVKPEDSGSAEAARPGSLIHGTQCFAGILDEGDLMACGDFFVCIEMRGVSERLNREYRLGSVRDRFLDQFRIRVQTRRADVHKHGLGTHIEDGVR